MPTMPAPPPPQREIPSQVLNRKIKEAVQEFYDATGMRTTQLEIDWSLHMDGTAYVSNSIRIIGNG